PIITDLVALSELLETVTGTGINIHQHQSGSLLNMSMRWISNENVTINMLSCFFRLNTAKNITDFMHGLGNWTAPPQNVVYGDIEGNIGMFIPGLHPIRAKNGVINPFLYTGSFVQPGNGSGEEWIGFIPLEHMPRSINPDQGYLASANQRSIAAANYNYSIGTKWTENYRGRRINHLLNSSFNLARENMIAFQGDIHDVAAERFLPPLLASLAAETLTGDYLAAFNELVWWNNTNGAYEMRKEWVAPTIFDLYTSTLENKTWDDEWTASGATGFLYPSLQYLEYMVREDISSPWFDDVRTIGITEDGNDVMVAAFKATIDRIGSKLGNWTSNDQRWAWGKNNLLMPVSI
nr:penicillin acylase family protein [Candidatus Sigynarchaeota archaeon]